MNTNECNNDLVKVNINLEQALPIGNTGNN